jgi:hypothetical protein
MQSWQNTITQAINGLFSQTSISISIRYILQDTIHRLPTQELKIMPADAEKKT